MTLLVIDDDDALLRVICLMLRNSGHCVMATTDPLTALEAVEHNAIDLLIADVEMPVVTGPELFAAARQLQPELPVLFISGARRPDENPFLLKPFDTEELLTAIHSAIEFTVSVPLGHS
jgi:CheY-like chemotaxis protein